MSSSKLVTPLEASNILSISRRAVLGLIERGELPAEKLPGRTTPYVLERSSVEALAENRAAEGVAR